MNTREKILEELIKAKGGYISGQELAEKFGVSRTVIWNCVNRLRDEGTKITSTTKNGYRIENYEEFSETEISSSIISNYLSDNTFWSSIVTLSETETTNDTAKEMIRDCPCPTVVIADCLTAARGRRGRVFYAPKGGLYMSCAFKPKVDSEDIQLITAAAATAVADAIDSIADITTDIKWVNDIMYQGKKLCGILTEAEFSVENSEWRFIVIGMGINIIPLPKAFGVDAVSLEEISQNRIDRNVLAAKILENLEKLIGNISSRNFISDYIRRSCIIGKTVDIIKPSEVLIGKAVNIDENAALIVEYEDGRIETINSGEISVREK